MHRGVGDGRRLQQEGERNEQRAADGGAERGEQQDEADGEEEEGAGGGGWSCGCLVMAALEPAIQEQKVAR